MTQFLFRNVRAKMREKEIKGERNYVGVVYSSKKSQGGKKPSR